MIIHKEPSPLCRQKVNIKPDANMLGGKEFVVEDWWDRVAGESWMFCDGNPGCLNYALRTGTAVMNGKMEVPTNNEVLYGKIGPFGHLVHIDEIEEPK